MLRAIASVEPRDKRIGPLVDWIMSQRRGSAWYSTLDTALVVMALSQIARPEEQPDVEVQVNGESVALKDGRVKLNGSHLRHGKNQVHVRCASDEPVHASALLRFFATDLKKAAENQAMSLRVERQVERAVLEGDTKQWKPLVSGDQVAPAEELRVIVKVAAPDGAERVMIESPIAAGTETRAAGIGEGDSWNYWFDRRELRDDRVSVAVGRLDATTRQFEYRLRPTLPGIYQVLPAVAFEMYDPDKRGFSKPFVLRVVDD